MDQRYHRQVRLPGFGQEAQRKLSRAGVIVIGAGGLGCPALQYLAAAGVGRLGIVDDDVVSLENLHRQVLYKTGDIGKQKTVCAKTTLSALNPEVQFDLYDTRLSNANAFGILGSFDVVIDGTDNFASRYMINDACVLMNKPLVYGSVSRYEGQVAVFDHSGGTDQPANYRDLFPEPPDKGEVLNCEETGVLGVLPGVIGTLQAAETLKLITGIGKPLINRLFLYQALTGNTFEMEIIPDVTHRSILPSSEEAFRNFDYEWFCHVADDPSVEIDSPEFEKMMGEGEIAVVDIRNHIMDPGFPESVHYYRIPFSSLQQDHKILENEKKVVVVCQSGISSLEAVDILAARFGSSKKIYSLKNGFAGWIKYINGKKNGA